MRRLIGVFVLISYIALRAGNFETTDNSDLEYSSDEESFESVESQQDSEDTFEFLLSDGLYQLDSGVENDFISGLTLSDYDDNKRLFEDYLYAAVKNLNLKRIGKLLTLGIPADIKINGTTMLCYLCLEDASRPNVLDAIRLFVQSGANIYQFLSPNETLMQYVRKANHKVAHVIDEYNAPEYVVSSESDSNSSEDVLDADETIKAGLLGDYLEPDVIGSDEKDLVQITEVKEQSVHSTRYFFVKNKFIISIFVAGISGLLYAYSYKIDQKNVSRNI